MRVLPVFCGALLVVGAVAAFAAGPDLSSGTRISVRSLDRIEGKQAEVGQSYRCTVDVAVMVHEKEAVKRGADCVLRITEMKEAGKLTGQNVLQLELSQIRVGSDLVDVSTEPVAVEGKGKGKSTAVKTGIGAAAGAGLGALFGGGKGAAIGAGAGAVGGAATSALTKGPEIKVAPETILTFAVR